MINFVDRCISLIIPKKNKQLGAFWLLLPSLVLMVGIFLFAIISFSKYSFYSFEKGSIIEDFQLSSYTKFLFDPFYWEIIGTTIGISALVTLICLILAYPIAYYMNKLTNQLVKEVLIFLIFIPLLVSVVVRSYGWLVLLSRQGLINWLLLKLELIQEPLELTYNMFGVIVALVHIFLPFMVLPLMNALGQMDNRLKQASYDLGANQYKTFGLVTFPLTLRGAITGIQIVFLLCLTAFATPSLIGGGRVMTLPTFIYQRTLETNWPLAAVASIFLIGVAIALILVLNWFVESKLFVRLIGGSSIDK